MSRLSDDDPEEERHVRPHQDDHDDEEEEEEDEEDAGAGRAAAAAAAADSSDEEWRGAGGGGGGGGADDDDEDERVDGSRKRVRASASAGAGAGGGAVDGAGRLPFVEKYRPKEMRDVVAQDDIIATLSRLMETNQLPHLLLYGPPGTGKTSTILAVARKMYGTERLGSMVMELNASDARGIDDVREQVVTFASTRKIFSTGMKLVILDEADNMTRDAQFALRRIIEKYAANTRFCLICNYVSKIIPALQSRCTRFRFSPLAPESVVHRVREICAAERIDASDDAVHALLTLGRGDMRKVLNLLEATSMQGPGARLEAKLVYAVAGKPTPQDVAGIADALWSHDVRRAVSEIGAVLVERGFALTDIVTELHDAVRRMKLPADVASLLLVELADAEHRLAGAVNDRIQLAGIVAVFQKARQLVGGGVAAGASSS